MKENGGYHSAAPELREAGTAAVHGDGSGGRAGGWMCVKQVEGLVELYTAEEVMQWQRSKVGQHTSAGTTH